MLIFIYGIEESTTNAGLFIGAIWEARWPLLCTLPRLDYGSPFDWLKLDESY
jgi:hypothetical protein